MLGCMTAGSMEGPAAYSLQDAAALLGVSVNTLRKRIRAGQVKAERVQRPQGYVWQVHLDSRQAPSQPAHDPAGQQAPWSLQDPPTALTQAEAMAAYTHSLLGPLVDRLEALSRENERLRLENDALRASQTPVAAQETAEAPPTGQKTPTPDEPVSAPWWRRWLAAVYG
jgi:hypothetical protein